MNIFYLDEDPKKSAKMHCDKHVVKMIIEYAQMLSTAHRTLDGEEYVDSSGGRKIKRWRLSDGRECAVYKASHVNHPSSVWVRERASQYKYMYDLFYALCDEYKFRYGREHLTDTKLRSILKNLPINISSDGWREPPQAMPEDVRSDSSIIAYHNYYAVYKKDFAKWTKREVPKFMKAG